MTLKEPKQIKIKKHALKAGSIHENIEINDEYSDEILLNKIIELELAMQIISNDKTLRSNRVNDLKEFNNQSLATQAKKRNSW